MYCFKRKQYRSEADAEHKVIINRQTEYTATVFTSFKQLWVIQKGSIMAFHNRIQNTYFEQNNAKFFYGVAH